MTDPYVTPTSDLAASSAPGYDVEAVRQGQKLIIYAILLNIGSAIVAQFAPILAVLSLFALGVSIYGLIKLFQGMKTETWARVLIFVSMLIPLINLLVLVLYNARATKILRSAGYKVGLMGASARAG